MTKEEHQAMKDHLLSSDSETLWNGVIRNFTYANAATFLVWVVLFIGDPDGAVGIFVWLKVLMVALIMTFSGWLADRLWFLLISEKFEKPFSFTAFASRAPFFFFLTGLFVIIPLLFSGLIAADQTAKYFLLSGTAQCAVQIPLQWVLFNRLRKLSLTNL